MYFYALLSSGPLPLAQHTGGRGSSPTVGAVALAYARILHCPILPATMYRTALSALPLLLRSPSPMPSLRTVVPVLVVGYCSDSDRLRRSRPTT
jgi:hypothetical protein